MARWVIALLIPVPRRRMADQLGVPGMIAPQVMNLMRMARAKGMGGDDSSSVIRIYEQALGREVRA